jgi:hypothetical protein
MLPMRGVRWFCLLLDGEIALLECMHATREVRVGSTGSSYIRQNQLNAPPQPGSPATCFYVHKYPWGYVLVFLLVWSTLTNSCSCTCMNSYVYHGIIGPTLPKAGTDPGLVPWRKRKTDLPKLYSSILREFGCVSTEVQVKRRRLKWLAGIYTPGWKTRDCPRLCCLES